LTSVRFTGVADWCPTPFLARRHYSTSIMSKTLLYDGRIFRSTSNSATGEVSAATTFRYHQSATEPHIVWAEYSGGSIVRGHLIGTVASDGSNVLDMRYHHVNDKGGIMTGQCKSTPEVLEDGRLRMHEQWKWTSGGGEEGQSVIEEVKEE
jgi:hypothetical protein